MVGLLTRLTRILVSEISRLPNLAMASTSQQYKSFDAEDYLGNTYHDVNAPDKILFRLESLHRAYHVLPSSLKVLDYGAGPVILPSISAAGRASEIVLADVSDSNREALRKWLKGDPTAFNWSPVIDHVVQKLEGKGEEEAREREVKVRQVVKDIVHCDINEDPPVQEGFEGPYDVVMDSWCLAYACATREIYEKGIGKLAGLLKPGGTLMIFASERNKPGSYVVGSTMYKSLPLNGEYLAKVLQEQGLSEVSVKTCSRIDSNNLLDNRDSTNTGYIFATAKKY